TFVVAYSDMLGDVAPEDAQNGEMLTFLNGVKNGADRLRRLIENFIMLVELQTDSAARTYAYRKRAISDLKSVIIMAAEDAQKIPEDGEYHFSIDVPDDLPVIEGDEEFLGRAIGHLVDNAFKFSTPDDVIDISAAQEGDEVVIRVTDHGRGIPEDELENVWKMFYQINRAHYEDQGAGSGLTIVRGITELHSGVAEIEHSEMGKGTTFMLRLPVEPVKTAEHTQQS
ncbi:MAG: HAMP domain-containing sensor histidine kinase, partial [Chloroflexota bacterium]